MRDGQGTLKYHDGGKYEGGWKNDKMHGKGVFIYPNGDVYDGTWNNGKRDGNGKIAI